jgi:hypothetical protein
MTDRVTPEIADQLPEQLEETGAGALKAGPLRFARMAGSSIAGRDAAAWMTDFLNAAYYRHPVEGRQVDDLRLAFGVLTTYWYREARSRHLRMSDLRAFHRAFGAHRFATAESARGLLNREEHLVVDRQLVRAAAGGSRPLAR